MRGREKYRRRLLSMLLTLTLLIPMLPMTSYAAPGTPHPGTVKVNGLNFNVPYEHYYYTNGGERTGSIYENPNWNAHYDPKTGVLTLRNYKGRKVFCNDINNPSITIKLIGDNKITERVDYAGLYNYNGGTTTITSDEPASLTIDVKGDFAYGIYAGKATDVHKGSVVLKGKAHVITNITATSSAEDMHAVGIFANEKISILEEASFTAKCQSATTSGGSHGRKAGAGLVALKEFTINTSGKIDIDTSACGAYNYAIYGQHLSSPAGSITKVGSMNLKWKSDGSNGGPLYEENKISIDRTTHIINVDNEKCEASYLYGKPYTLTVIGGKCDAKSGQYGAGETAYITADRLDSGLSFDRWTADNISAFTPSPKSETAGFRIWDKDVKLKANYHAFQEQPSFMRKDANNGVIRFKTAAKEDVDSNDNVRLISGIGTENDVIKNTYFSSENSDFSKEINSTDVRNGNYRIAIKIDNLWHFSEVFSVDYSETTPLTFTYSSDYDIPAGVVETTYQATKSLKDAVSGGSGSYSFRVDPSFPGLSVNTSDNTLEYIRTAAQGSGIATIKVWDNNTFFKTIEVNIGEVTKGDVSLSNIQVQGKVYDSMDLSQVKLEATKIPNKDGTLSLDEGQTLALGQNTLNWTFKPDDSLNYNEAHGSVTFDVLKDTLKSISASGAPDRTEYEWGDEFETKGLTVTATYDSGTEKNVTSMVTAGPLKVGDTEATLNYGAKSCTVSGITVAKKKIPVNQIKWDYNSAYPFTYDGSEKSIELKGLIPHYDKYIEIKNIKDNRATSPGTYNASAEIHLRDSTNTEYNTPVFGGGPYTVTSNWSINHLSSGGRNLIKNIKAGDVSVQTVKLSEFGLITDGSFALTAGESITDAAGILDGNPAYGPQITFKLKDNARPGDTVTIPLTFTPSDTNYITRKLTLTIEVKAKDSPNLNLSPVTATFTGEAVADSAIIGIASFAGQTVKGAFTWKVGQGITKVKDSGIKTVVFTPDDTMIYENVEANVKLTINKAHFTGAPSYTKIMKEDQVLSNAKLGLGSLSPTGLTMILSWDEPQDTPVIKGRAYAWTYYGSGSDEDNYEPLKGSIVLWEDENSGGGSTGGGSTGGGSTGGGGSTEGGGSTDGGSSGEGSTGGGDSGATTGGGATDTAETNTPATTETVHVETTPNGSLSLSPDHPKKGDRVTISLKPDKGYMLEKLKVIDEEGREIKLTKRAGNYTFILPEGEVHIKASFIPELKFSDIEAGDWYSEAVSWAVINGITTGTTAHTFSPKATCTRAQMVTFLWRAGGEEEALKTENSFSDVGETTYYYKVLLWAFEKGLVSGTREGRFSPELVSTRAQIVTLLYRFAGSPPVSKQLQFSDVKEDAYYNKAVAWAAEQGITSGTSLAHFSPDAECTRAEIVTFLYRFMTRKEE